MSDDLPPSEAVRITRRDKKREMPMVVDGYALRLRFKKKSVNRKPHMATWDSKSHRWTRSK